MHDIIFGMCVCVDVDSALTAEHYDIPRTITCFARHQVIKAGTSFQSHVAPNLQKIQQHCMCLGTTRLGLSSLAA